MSKSSRFEIIKSGLTDTSEAPKGKNMFYLCQECGDAIPSMPKQNVGCKCGNIYIDIDYFRLAVKNFDKFLVVTKTKSL